MNGRAAVIDAFSPTYPKGGQQKAEFHALVKCFVTCAVVLDSTLNASRGKEIALFKLLEAQLLALHAIAHSTKDYNDK